MDGQNMFSMSLGDLMASVLLIFILLFSAVLLHLQREYTQKVNDLNKVESQLRASDLTAKEVKYITTGYELRKKRLYKELVTEFESDLKDWKADIDATTLSIRFRNPEDLFDLGKADLKIHFKEVLDGFFPRYIMVLNKPEYRENIEEIRIEGHTSSEWNQENNTTVSYFRNMKLSQNRTRSVLEYSLSLLNGKFEDDVIQWARLNITANGLSSSKIIRDDSGIEDREASRRVEFRIKTNAESLIDEIYTKFRSQAEDEQRQIQTDI